MTEEVTSSNGIRQYQSGNDLILEHRFRKRNAQYFWQLSRAVTQCIEKGKITSWVGTSTAIQERKNFAEDGTAGECPNTTTG